MIKHLIRLDFYAMKPLRKFIFSFIFIPIILGVVVDPGMSIMVTLTFMVFMLNIVFAITERSNFNKLYGVLPIKKSTNTYCNWCYCNNIIHPFLNTFCYHQGRCWLDIRYTVFSYIHIDCDIIHQCSIPILFQIRLRKGEYYGNIALYRLFCHWYSSCKLSYEQSSFLSLYNEYGCLFPI